MRSRLMAAILCTTMLVTGCAGDGGSNGSSFTGWASAARDTARNATNAALGTTGAFALQVARRGCGENPYVGKSPVEVLALATTYTTIATTGYADGIARAQVALDLQQEANLDVIGSFDALSGSIGFEGGFGNLQTIDTSSESVDRLAEELRRRHAAEPLPEPVMAKLLEANRAMHVGNHFQVDAAVGVLLLSLYIAEALDRGGSSALTHIMLAEAGRDGRALVDSVTRSPATLMSMVLNLGNAYNLHRTVNEVTNFDELDGALGMLGVKANIDAFEAAAQAKARSLRSQYPQELDYQPTGAFARSFLIGVLERRGVSQFVSAPVLDVAFMACGGVFGDTGVVVTVDPAAPLDEAGVRAAQQALIDLGHLRGRADGVPGRMTAGAVMDFQRARGLAVNGELTQGLLAELRLAQGAAVAPAAGPGTSGTPGTQRAARSGAAPQSGSCADPNDSAVIAGVKDTFVGLHRMLGSLVGEEPVACP